MNGDGTLDRISIVTPGAQANGVLTAALGGGGKIYIGGGFTFVNQISQPALARLNAFQPTAAFADYDGDGRTDAAVWRAGVYYILGSANGGVSYGSFGTGGDVPVASAFVQ